MTERKVGNCAEVKKKEQSDERSTGGGAGHENRGDEGRKGDMQVTPLYNNTFSCQGHRNVLKLMHTGLI